MRRMLTRLPLALVGWDTEQQTIKLPLFKKFRERPDMPFCNLRAALQVLAPLNHSGCMYLPPRSSRSTSLTSSRRTAGVLGIWCIGSPLFLLERNDVPCRRMQGAESGHGCTAQSHMWIWTWDTLGVLSIGYGSECLFSNHDALPRALTPSHDPNKMHAILRT